MGMVIKYGYGYRYLKTAQFESKGERQIERERERERGKFNSITAMRYTESNGANYIYICTISYTLYKNAIHTHMNRQTNTYTQTHTHTSTCTSAYKWATNPVPQAKLANLTIHIYTYTII